MTNSDCLFNKQTFDINLFKNFTSEQLSSIVGKQSPNGYQENISYFVWKFLYVDTEDLKFSTEYYEEPEGGWKKTYLQFIKDDEKAAKHSPEYLGRDNWIKNEWIKCTDTYPLFVIFEDNHFRLLDGHHRLAGAFYYDLKKVAVILGKPS